MAWKTIYKGNSEDEAGAAVRNALKRVTPQLQQGVVKPGQDEDIRPKKTSDFAKEKSSRYKGPEKSRADHNSDIMSGDLGKKR